MIESKDDIRVVSWLIIVRSVFLIAFVSAQKKTPVRGDARSPLWRVAGEYHPPATLAWKDSNRP